MAWCNYALAYISYNPSMQLMPPVPLDHSLLPLSLYHKAKSLIWDPREIDLSQDAHDWQRLSDRERDIILRLSSQFLGGEEAVTHDLAPLLTAIRHDGNLMEEEIFLTAHCSRKANTSSGLIDGSLPSPLSRRERGRG